MPSEKIRLADSMHETVSIPQVQARIAKSTVAAALINGRSLKEAALAAGVRPATVTAWRRDADDEFNDMLLSATDDIVAKILETAKGEYLERLTLLGTRAAEVLEEDMTQSRDRKLRQSAAALVLRNAPTSKQVDVHVGIEQVIAANPPLPTLGD